MSIWTRSEIGVHNSTHSVLVLGRKGKRHSCI